MYRGLFPSTFSPLTFDRSTYGEASSAVVVIIKGWKIRQVERSSEIGSKMSRDPTKGKENNPSTAAGFLRFRTGTIILYAALSLQIGDEYCG